MAKKLSIEEIRELIAAEYAPKTILGNWSPPHSYKEYEEIKSSDYRTKEQTIGLKIGINKTGPILLLILATVYLFTFPFLNPAKETSGFIALTYCLSFGLIVFSVYNLFFNHKIIFKTTADSFTFKEQTILWNEILTTGIVTVSGGKGRHYLLLGLSNGNLVKIEVEKSDIGAHNLIRIIHLNRPVADTDKA